MFYQPRPVPLENSNQKSLGKRRYVVWASFGLGFDSDRQVVLSRGTSVSTYSGVN